MPLSKNLRREPSIAITVGTTTFNAPGIYYPPYGKSVFLLSGKGSPGNATVPGNVSGSNTFTYSEYTPASGGNYAGTNSFSYSEYVPASGGNYAGTNSFSYSEYVPASGGNPAGSNPDTPGNSNPPTPGNFAGVNPTTPGNLDANMWNSTIYYSSVTNPGFSPQFGYQAGSSDSGTFYGQGGTSGVYSPPSPFSNTLGPSFYSVPGQSYTVYYSVTYAYAYPAFNPSTPGNPFNNPTTPGNTNPTTPGNPIYNPYSPGFSYNVDVPGNPIYNPYSPGFSYNVDVPGNPIYNPYSPASYNEITVPGNPNFNPITPGNAGTNYAVLGVPLPGGASDTSAPVVGFSAITVAYSTSGVPISVPPGGYVAVQNKRPGT